jgi:hypothetical protein
MTIRGRTPNKSLFSIPAAALFSPALFSLAAGDRKDLPPPAKLNDLYLSLLDRKPS